MSLQSNTLVPPSVISEPRPITAEPSRAAALLYRTLAFPLKFLWGMIFCQSLLGSIFVVGWTYRFAQRSAFKFWWSRRLCPDGDTTFKQFLSRSERTKQHRNWPNWFLQQNFRRRSAPVADDSVGESTVSQIWNRALRLPRALFHSLWLNFWIGLRGIANTWVLTLPACLFWWFGWYDGWNNSFNKGYEQAPVGPLISIFGILLFIAAMFYVPMAQARQAVTGEWRSFFQFRVIWRLVRFRWISSIILALLYSLLAAPLNVLKTVPMFQPQTNASLIDLRDAEVLNHLNNYFFWCSILMLPAYVVLRVVAGRIYASGILGLVQTSAIQSTELSPLECETLGRLGLLEPRPLRERRVFVRFMAWTGKRIGRITSAWALILIWFSFVAQIYISEFFNYHNGVGWMNQPLVQLPLFHYVPARLKNPWTECSIAILVWLLASLVAKGAQAIRLKRA